MAYDTEAEYYADSGIHVPKDYRDCPCAECRSEGRYPDTENICIFN